MGYCTRYSLEVKEGDLRIQEILDQVENEFEGLNYAIDSDGDSLDSVKWYEHEAEMHFLSLKFPNIVFQLHGEGEESGDVWYKYFKNGSLQHCPAVITFAEYDEKKLK
jgi:hypothetical protein